MATAVSATAICAGTCSDVFAPMLPTRTAPKSLKQFSAPCSPPIAAVDTARTKIWPNGSLYSGAVKVSRPGLVPMKPSLALCVRYSGTNTSLTTMSLEPVAFRPIVCQVSTISKSDFGSRKVRYSGGWPSLKIRPPRNTQSQWSMPLEKPQRPLNLKPPSTGVTWPLGM